MQLCLGTVQFGMDYGIRGQQRPCIRDAVKMLDFAYNHGINTFDTAYQYGLAEEVLGTWIYHRSPDRSHINIISKLKPNIFDGIPSDKYYETAKQNLTDSLLRLDVQYLDGYLLHSSRYVFNDEIIAALARLKQEGLTRQIGVSTYEVDESLHGINHPDIDIIQLPYSILDQRMKHGAVFELALAANSTTLHSRSAFIQGLIFMNENEIPPFLAKAVPIVNRLRKVSEETGLSVLELALSYVKSQGAISHLVIGVDNETQLKENILAFNKETTQDIVAEVAKNFESLDADIVMPSLWKK